MEESHEESSSTLKCNAKKESEDGINSFCQFLLLIFRLFNRNLVKEILLPRTNQLMLEFHLLPLKPAVTSQNRPGKGHNQNGSNRISVPKSTVAQLWK